MHSEPSGRATRRPSKRALREQATSQLTLLLLAIVFCLTRTPKCRAQNTNSIYLMKTIIILDNQRASNRLQSASLQLESQPTAEFEQPVGNQTVAVGRDAQLSCKIRNLGNYRTAWLRVEDKGILTIHNNIITQNYRVGLLNNEREFVLLIKNVQPSDRGAYMCQINSVPMKSSVGHLDVLTAPVFDDQPAGAESNATAAPVTVAEGANVTLSCRARGHPAPSIIWRRENSTGSLADGDSTSVVYSASTSTSKPTASATEPASEQVESTLTFSAVQRTNSGAHLCIASNGVQPSASRRQVLDVQFAPVIVLPQTELAAQLGQPEAQLECLIELNPVGSYHWVKLRVDSSGRQQQQQQDPDDLWLIEHDELIQSDKYEIVIKQLNSEKVQMLLNVRHLEPQDFAHYKCIARNSLGLQSNAIRLYDSGGRMFRPGGAGGQSPDSWPPSSRTQPLAPSGDDRQQSRTNSIDTNGNDFPAHKHQHLNQRAHTRSSWLQRAASTSGGPNYASTRSSAATARSQTEVFLLLLLCSMLWACCSVATGAIGRPNLS